MVVRKSSKSHKYLSRKERTRPKLLSYSESADSSKSLAAADNEAERPALTPVEM
jgi:hypothetical protein